MKDNLNFYRQGDAFGEFSNFWHAPITIGGVEWPTTEHYFQAQKFALADDQQYVEMIRMAPTAGDAAKMGRNRKWPLRPDWEEVKDDIMRECVRQKFFQHPSLAKVLISTGERHLVEHTKNDRYWADGGDGKGKNMLGLILMEVREALASISEEEIAKEVEEARSLKDV
ncbi:N-glycosidase YbiA [Entomortierella parvispora]|uniref:N-glycosidase YbiA n=1 Tax=Entomortierella parvispora TaxID=205924 RepID=A0A9P3M258_9FUNG|nr:N-glycosidase YbiA [Entomortierella parvispora]